MSTILFNLAAVLLLIVCNSTVFAKKSGEILILANGSIDESTTRLINAIKPHYGGVITVKTELPLELTYDAVMAVGLDQVYFDSLEESRLKNYVESGGKFYAEGSQFMGETNNFWRAIGCHSVVSYELTLFIDKINGVRSSFTEGISVSLSEQVYVGDHGIKVLPMLTVLQAEGRERVDVAWMSPYPNVKAVLHWPITSDYYDQFIPRVVCSYFQLCGLEVSNPGIEARSIIFDQINSELSLPGSGSLLVTDIRGRTVLSKDVVITQPQRLDLPSGNYFVRWHSKTAHASTKITVY